MTEKEETDKLFECIRARYGSRVGAEELKELRQAVEEIVRSSRTLRGIRLPFEAGPFDPIRSP